ncbi:hypothetical protein HJC23_009502 [Cyclotella cryptica]|uniref:Uncharacterized protein n=1 Tax=Cyclotella cryptica TaxID=29204 RepID=A0ABD3Q609_9STRA|eukprot:CCRYP_008825-RA/>CCRYP_008825-RA protein AED:0.02 eAED:0.02 QI:26/1/1/1/0.5/0.33/3/2931/249
MKDLKALTSNDAPIKHRHCGTNTTMSLQQVAQRIHERNNALATEQATLELLHDQIDFAKKRLNEDQLATQSVRKELLTVLRLRHGVELDCLQLTEEANTMEKSTATTQASINGVRLKTNEIRKKFEDEQAPIYAAHDVSITLHAMHSESILVRAQRKKQRREEMLSELRQQTDRQRAEAESMREEMGRIRDQLSAFDRREEEEDEEMVGLTMQIRQVLAKKTSTRQSLNNAREVLQTAVDNRDNWKSKQ